ncbi:hypothetical protein Goklo_022305 [Gossypium klotzschianum]|uniref:Aminotransferase-like plant mobile domain-containing protein n=1 Tax=Gossypium klotzschianum TaxID=34286 RepID=A0A7J8TM42_9ROSI|nr:hypothetical protein [Gossypium klotzschianum]
METSLIHFDDNHIFVVQAADNRVLKAFRHDLAKPSITEIYGYLQEAGFLHAFRMLGAANLILDSLARWWKDGDPRHTFHIPCSKCTITLENVVLRLGLSVDGSVVTGAVIVPDKEDLCTTLLGKVTNKFDGG